MTVDLAVLALLAFFGFFGWRSGAIRQLSHWCGLGAGWLAAGPLASRLAPRLTPRTGLPTPIAHILLSSILFTAFGGLGAWLTHALLTKLAGGRVNGRADDAAGAVLGVGKGGALVFIALSLLIFFEVPLTKLTGPLPPAVADSAAVAFVRRHCLLDVPLPALARLRTLLAAVRDPRAARALSDPKLRSLLNDRGLRSALKNEEFANSILSGDLSALKKSPELTALLRDPRLTGKQ